MTSHTAATDLAGFRGAVPTVLGLEAGLYLWALAAAGGFAALVAASEVAFLALRVVGAVVLLVLGVQALRGAWRDRGTAVESVTDASARGWRRSFAEGLLVQLANPKAAVFMLAFYRQLVPADQPLLATTALLALVQVTLETAVSLTLAALVAPAGAWLHRPAIRRRLEAVSDTVLIALGLRVATSSR